MTISERERLIEINRQLRDYGRAMLRMDTLSRKSAYCDTFVDDVREAQKKAGWWFFNRAKRQRKAVEKVLQRIEGKS